MAHQFDDIDEELVDEAFALSPLNAIDADDLDRLTPKMQVFFMELIATGSVPLARKKAQVKSQTWAEWQSQEYFQHVLKTVRSPVAFARQLSNAILLKALSKTYALLDDDRISVAQWAIDKSLQIANIFRPTSDEDDSKRRLYSPDEVRALAAEAAKQLPAGQPSTPFEIIDAQVVELPAEEPPAAEA